MAAPCKKSKKIIGVEKFNEMAKRRQLLNYNGPTIDSLYKDYVCNESDMETLYKLIRNRKNAIIYGAPGSRKTTMQEALIAEAVGDNKVLFISPEGELDAQNIPNLTTISADSQAPKSVKGFDYSFWDFSWDKALEFAPALLRAVLECNIPVITTLNIGWTTRNKSGINQITDVYDTLKDYLLAAMDIKHEGPPVSPKLQKEIDRFTGFIRQAFMADTYYIYMKDMACESVVHCELTPIDK